MVTFVGRGRELATLDEILRTVGAEVGRPRPGRCLLIRGRRRIGTSTLVEAFADQAGAPSVFFTAAGASEAAEPEALTEAVSSCTLPERDVFADATPGNWTAALRQLAGVLPEDRPSVVVIDEVPYLMDRVDAFEGILQRAWDRELSRKPVLILIGSDLEHAPFDAHDLAALHRHRGALTDAPTPLGASGSPVMPDAGAAT